jgi:hypothetical protein
MVILWMLGIKNEEAQTMGKLFQTEKQRFRIVAGLDLAIQKMKDEQVVMEAKQGNQSAVALLFIRNDGIMGKEFNQFKSSFSQDDFEGECLAIFSDVIDDYDINGGTQFSTYLHYILHRRFLNIVKAKNAIKRSKYDAVSFEELATYDDNGNIKPFEIATEADFGSANIKEFISHIELNDGEKAFIDYFMKYGKGFKGDNGEVMADFANHMGFSRANANNIKNSLKVKLASLQFDM